MCNRRRLFFAFGWFCSYVVVLVGGCSFSITSGDSDYLNNYDYPTDENPDTDGSHESMDDHINEHGCYPDEAVGCSSLSWSEVETSFGALFAMDDSHVGLSQREGAAVAQTVYEKGVYPKARLSVLDNQYLGGGRFRTFVMATNNDGYPAVGLARNDFVMTADDGESTPPIRIRRFGDISSNEISVELSAVIDDSGSVQDCDAHHIAEGLTILLEKLPPVYRANLIKFETDVYRAHDYTANVQALSNRMINYCTDRGSTALWDAAELAMDGGGESEPDLKVVIAFSDGVDNSSSIEFGEIMANAREERIPFFVVALGLADVFSLLDLSSSTGGGLVYVHTGEDIPEAFLQISTFMNEIYIVEWQAGGPFEAATISTTNQDGVEISNSFWP